MLKMIFVMTALGTLLLNILVTYYLMKENLHGHEGYMENNKVVSFDLSLGKRNQNEAEDTEALDTELLAVQASKDRW